MVDGGGGCVRHFEGVAVVIVLVDAGADDSGLGVVFVV